MGVFGQWGACGTGSVLSVGRNLARRRAWRAVSSRNRLGDAREHVPEGRPCLGNDFGVVDLHSRDPKAGNCKGHGDSMITVRVDTGGVENAGR